MVDVSPRPDLRRRFLDWSQIDPAATALVTPDGHDLTYGDLARRVADAAQRLGPVRRLVQLEIQTDVEAVVWYLGALAGGHPVILTSGVDSPAVHEANRRIAAQYQPDVVIAPRVDGWAMDERHPTSAHRLHPDLAVLLSTSGSTGSAKLVRLSHENLRANAEAIADYLALTPADRAIMTLPLQYCYGLSVLHSHLVAGASVVLSHASVVDACFWATVERTRPTTLAGVPYTFDLLARTEDFEQHWPTLRLITQAGGRLPADDVRAWANRGQRHGWDLVVMYGQTEATARMAFLPAHLAATHPRSVGIPIPGAAIDIDRCGPDGVGEVVFRGPSVMMGYAETPADLGLDATVDHLRTGDVGRWNDAGLLEIVGRSADFIKIFGLRVDLGAVRDYLAERAIPATVDGDDAGVVIAVHGSEAVDRVAADVRARFALPAAAVVVAPLDDLPRLENGKVDRVTLRRVVRAAPAMQPTAPAADDACPVRALYQRVLGVPSVDDQDTFVSLGGDSLSYVEASIALEALLGDVPADWHQRPVEQLVPSAGPRRRTARVDTSVVLRAASILTIVGSHASLFHIIGGAHLLLAVAGANFARFGLGRDHPWRPIARIAVPAMVWIGAMALLGKGFDLRHVLLVRSLDLGGGRWVYWFVEALVQALIVTTVVMRIGPLRRLEHRRPYLTALAATACTLAIRFDLLPLDEHTMARFRPYEIAWLFMLGWLVARSSTTGQRLLTSAISVVAVYNFFHHPAREAFIIVGLLALIWLPTVRVPRATLPAVSALASASLYIYLTHVEIYPIWRHDAPWLALGASLAVGIVVRRLVDDGVPSARRWIVSRRPQRRRPVLHG